jgi:protease-4
MSSDNPSTEPPRVGPRTVTYRQPPRSGSRWLVGCLAFAVGGIALVMLLCVVAVVGFFFMVVGSAQFAAEEGPGAAIHEVTVSGQGAAAKVALIPISGILAPGFGGDPEPLFKAMLKRARTDDSVRAVILTVDSGGGGITTSDIMYKDLQDFRDETHKPVVVLMGDVTASGAYYVSCAADYLMAHPTTITASIGVMMPLFNANDLMKKVGVTNETIATGPYKEVGSFWGRSPEQWQKDKELLSGIMDEMYSRFVGVVVKGRGLDEATVRELADGRIYSAQQALDNKLIDAIGYMDDAETQVKKMTGLTDIRVVQYGRMPSLRELLLGASGRHEMTVKLDASGVTGAAGPAADMGRPMYYWQP